MPKTAVRTGVTLDDETSGEGEPLLLVMGTFGAIPLGGELLPRLSERYRGIAFDDRAPRRACCRRAQPRPAERHHGPTLVPVGEQDLLTPTWQSQAVADAIPGARFELVTGPGSSHCLHLERPDDVVRLVDDFLQSQQASA